MISTLSGAAAVAAALSASLVQASAPLRARQDTDTLTWQACPGADAPWECATMDVPLDYANESAGTTQIAVIRYPASVTPRKGSMFMNPGGPGVSGVDWLSTGGPSFQSEFGEDWDVLSWDPRGVGLSGPKLVQFETDDEETEFWTPVMTPGTFEAHGNLTRPDDVEFFMSQASIMDDRLKALNDLFVERNGDNLKYVGSAAVIRDLVALVDAIEGPGADINFYGYSYGTLLAMQLTQMFPDRIGKVLIDGVVDPVDWSQYQPYLGWDLDIADAEAGWKGFTQACAQVGPTGCTLAVSSGTTPEEVDALMNEILNTVYENWSDIRFYSHNEVLEVVFSNLYSPSSWPDLSTFLGQFVSTRSPSRKSTGIRRPLPPVRAPGMLNRVRPIPGKKAVGVAPLPGGIPVPLGQIDNDPLSGGERAAYKMSDYGIVAIFCGDAVDTNGATTEDVFAEMVRVSQTVSYKFGSQFNSRFFCHRWTSKAVERYDGPWNVKPKNTVLVIGNEADPITPYRSAKLIASGDHLGSSARLIQQWDFGHTSGAETSDCTAQAIFNYVNESGEQIADAGNDDADLICPTNFSIMGLSETIHWDPVTSENGDALTSGPNDPGLGNLGNGGDVGGDSSGAFEMAGLPGYATLGGLAVAGLMGIML